MRILSLIICVSFAITANAQQPWTPIHWDKVYNYENCKTYDIGIFCPELTTVNQ